MNALKMLLTWITPKDPRAERLKELVEKAKAQPDNDLLWLRVADAHLELSDEASALMALWRAADSNIRKNKLTRIAAIMRRVVLLAPSSSRAHLLLGRSLDELGMSRDASIALAEAALRLDREQQYDLAKEVKTRAVELKEIAEQVEYIQPDARGEDEANEGPGIHDDSTLEMSIASLSSMIESASRALR